MNQSRLRFEVPPRKANYAYLGAACLSVRQGNLNLPDDFVRLGRVALGQSLVIACARDGLYRIVQAAPKDLSIRETHLQFYCECLLAHRG